MEKPVSPVLLSRIEPKGYDLPNDVLTETYREMGFPDDGIAWHRKLPGAPNWTYQQFKDNCPLVYRTSVTHYGNQQDEDSDEDWEDEDDSEDLEIQLLTQISNIKPILFEPTMPPSIVLEEPNFTPLSLSEVPDDSNDLVYSHRTTKTMLTSSPSKYFQKIHHSVPSPKSPYNTNNSLFSIKEEARLEDYATPYDIQPRTMRKEYLNKFLTGVLRLNSRIHIHDPGGNSRKGSSG